MLLFIWACYYNIIYATFGSPWSKLSLVLWNILSAVELLNRRLLYMSNPLCVLMVITCSTTHRAPATGTHVAGLVL